MAALQRGVLPVSALLVRRGGHARCFVVDRAPCGSGSQRDPDHQRHRRHVPEVLCRGAASPLAAVRLWRASPMGTYLEL